MKTITIILMSMLMIAGVIGGGILTTREFSMDSSKVDNILTTSKAVSLKPSISEMICNTKQCSVWVKQDNIIQSEIFIDRARCTKVEIQYILERYRNETVCLQMTDYSNEELNKMVDERIKSILEEYASSIEREKNDTKVVKQPPAELSMSTGTIKGAPKEEEVIK